MPKQYNKSPQSPYLMSSASADTTFSRNAFYFVLLFGVSACGPEPSGHTEMTHVDGGPDRKITPEMNTSIDALEITPEIIEGSWISSDFETQANTCEIPDRKVDAISFKFMKKDNETADYIECNNGRFDLCDAEASAAPEISSSFVFEIRHTFDGNEEGSNCLVTMLETIEISMKTKNSGSLKRYISAQRTEGTECDEYQQSLIQASKGDPDAYITNFINENGCNAEYSYTISRSEE